MRTSVPDERSELWSRRVRLNDLDLDVSQPGGLDVTVDQLDAAAFERVLVVLDDVRLDRVELDRIEEADVCRVIAVMRECQSRDVELILPTSPAIDAASESLAHLANRLSNGDQRLDLYRRHGPGFIQVVDDRPGRHRRIVFDDPGDVEMIVRLDRPTPVDRLESDRLATLRELDLVAVVDDLAVLTVARIKRWPVPLDDLFDPPTA